MKSTKKTFTQFFALSVFILVLAISSTLSARDYYQIKVYNLKDKAQESAVDSYLQNAYLPALHKAGIKTVVQPGGSVKDKDTIDFCNQHNIAMVFTGNRPD